MSDIRADILAAAAANAGPTRQQTVARAAVLVGTGFVAAAAIFLWWGGFRSWGAPRPPELIALSFIGTVAIAAGALQVGYGRGGSVVGRASSTLLAGAAATPVALLLWKWFWSAQFEHGTDWWADRPGLRCLGLTTAMATAIMGGLVASRWHSDPLHPRITGAALGVAAAAAAAVFTDLWCPVGHPLHVALGHVLPMLVFGGVGALIGSALIGLRPLQR